MGEFTALWLTTPNFNCRILVEFLSGLVTSFSQLSHPPLQRSLTVSTFYRRNMKLLHSAGRGPALLATFANGIAYEFVAGDMVSKETVVDSNISQMIIEMMAVMHSLDMSGADGKPCLWDRMRKFHAASPDGFMNDPAKEEHYRKAALPSKLELAREIELMEKELGDVQSPIVFCHNDLLLGNIVINKDGRGVTFIDYEYGEANYQAFDIADHFTEFVGVDVELDYDKHYPNEDFQKDWLRRYLSAYNDKAPSDKEVHELYVLVNKFALCANLKWGLWALAQAKSSTIDFDFILYAKQRLNEYKKKKEAFLAMN